MVNERGTIKWTSIMLPEHVQALNKLFEEQDYKQKPILDDQQLIEIDAKLRQAKKDNLAVEIKYYADHDYQTANGKLLTIDALHKYIRVDDEDLTEIAFKDILDVSINGKKAD